MMSSFFLLPMLLNTAGSTSIATMPTKTPAQKDDTEYITFISSIGCYLHLRPALRPCFYPTLYEPLGFIGKHFIIALHTETEAANSMHATPKKIVSGFFLFVHAVFTPNTTYPSFSPNPFTMQVTLTRCSLPVNFF